MKNKMILVLSGLIMSNTVLGKVGGEDDVFETKEDVFGSNEAQPVHQETITTNEEINTESTITNEELKVQVIPNWWSALREKNGFIIQKGMDQYIIEGVVYKEDIEKVLVKLRPFYTDKAKKLGKKPIIFKCQEFINYDEAIEETDEFSIESFLVFQYCNDTDEFGKFYNALIKYGKPIVFEHVKATYKDEIEKKYDLSNCKINGYFDFVSSFDEYLKLKELGIENLKISTATVNFKPFSDQNLKKKLELFLKSVEAKSKEEIKKGAELLSGLLNKSMVHHTIFECFEIILEKDWNTDLDAYLNNTVVNLIRHIEEAEKFPITEEKELRKQLYAYTRDNRIEEIEIKNLCFSNSYEKGTVSIPIEYVSFLKLDFATNYKTQLINPKNTEGILFVPKEICMLENVTCDTLFCDELEEVGKNVSCKTIICQDLDKKLDDLIDCLVKIKNLETVLIGVNSEGLDKIKKGVALDEDDKKLIKPLAEKNISLGFYDKENLDKVDDYEDYIKAKNIMHLSGYVNVKNKPDELSDEEWNQVLVLKQKVKEIIKEIQKEGVKIPEKLK